PAPPDVHEGALSQPLKDGLLGEGPEDLLEGGDHLALGGAGPGAVEEERHQVLAVAGGRLLEGDERALDGGTVAARLRRLEPIRLAPLDLGVGTVDLGLDLVVDA